MDALLLPPRPLRLQPGHLKTVWRLGVLLILLGVGALGVAIWQSSDCFGLRHKQAVLADGVPAVHSSMKGYRADITSAFISRTKVPSGDSGGFALLRDYVLTIDYTDAQGATHSHDIEFMCLFGSIDERSEILVRYDRQHPDDFALSWAVAMNGNRMAADSIQVVILVLVGLGLLWGAYATLNHGYDAVRACEDGEEVKLQIVSAEKLSQGGQPTGAVLYRYRVAGEPESKIRKETLAKRSSPLMLDVGNRFMLGLRSPRNGGRILVIKDDLSPLAFTAEEKEGIRQRLAARRVGPVGA